MEIRDVRRILGSKQTMSNAKARLISPSLRKGSMGRSNEVVIS